MSDPIVSPKHVVQSVKAKMGKTNKKLQKRGSIPKNFKALKSIDPTAFNGQAEQAFVELVRRMIEVKNGNPVALAAVYQETAYKLDVSTETVKRYLFKHSAETAELRVFGKMVFLNPNFAEELDEEEEQEKEPE